MLAVALLYYRAVSEISVACRLKATIFSRLLCSLSVAGPPIVVGVNEPIEASIAYVAVWLQFSFDIIAGLTTNSWISMLVIGSRKRMYT